MSGNSILLDTNIALYLLSGDEDLADLLFGKKFYISFITQLELLSYPKISEQELDQVRLFLDACVIIDINSRIKEEVVMIKKSNKIKLPDSIILATSRYLRVPLISSDKEFSRIEHVEVILYEK